jgi:hypothetical protein
MNTIWDIDLDEDNYDSNNKTSQSQKINFALMTMISGMDVVIIIATKNIIDPITIELLYNIAESKKLKTQLITMACNQASTSTTLMQSPSSSHEEVIKTTPSTSTLKIIKEPTLTSSTIMASPPSPSTNMASSSISTTLEIYSSLISCYIKEKEIKIYIICILIILTLMKLV